MRTVLQLIAEESSLNIVASDTVSGNVTLRLINVPWDQALDIVLRAKGLDKRRDGNVVWVAPQAEMAEYEQAQGRRPHRASRTRGELVTEYIPINYGNAEDIAKLLTEARASRRRRRRWRRRRRPAAARLPVAARQRQLRPPHQHPAGQRHPARRSPRSSSLVGGARPPGRPGADRGPHRDRRPRRSPANWAPSSASPAYKDDDRCSMATSSNTATQLVAQRQPRRTARSPRRTRCDPTITKA